MNVPELLAIRYVTHVLIRIAICIWQFKQYRT